MTKRIIYIFSLLLFGLIPSFVNAQGWIWGRSTTGINEQFDAYSVAIDASGNVYGGGFINTNVLPVHFGSVTVPCILPTFNPQPMWVKYDPLGNVLWAGSVTAGNDVTFIDLTTDPSGNLIVYGYFQGPTMTIGSFTLTNPSIFHYQFWLAKISPAGTVLWALNDGEINGFDGNFLKLILHPLTTDSAGNIYVSGPFIKSSTTIGTTTITNSSVGYRDVYLAKYSPSGVNLWATKFGGIYDEFPMGIKVSSAGNVYVAGVYNSPSVTIGPSTLTNPYSTPITPINKTFIAEFSSSGTPLWAIGTGGSHASYASAITSDNSGNIYVTGSFRDSAINFGSVTINHPYLAPLMNLAQYVIRLNSTNTVDWYKTIGSKGHDVDGYSVAYSPCGKVWISGDCTSTIHLDSLDSFAAVPGFDPCFIAGYDPSGATPAVVAGLGSGGEDINGIACDPSGNVLLCGDYWLDSVTRVLSAGPDTLSGVPNDTFTTVEFNEYFFVAKFIPPTDTTHATHDSLVCASQSGFTITAPAGYSSYMWNNGSTSSSLLVTTPGQYYVSCVICGNALIDTFNIQFGTTDSSIISHDTAACSSAFPIFLYPPPGYTNALWSTGSHTDSISVSTGGKYWVRAYKACALLIDSFKVTDIPSPLINLGKDTGFCNGDSIMLKSRQPSGSALLWSTGSAADSITVTTAGSYWLQVTDSGCISADTIHITTSSPPAPISLGPDTILCTGEQFQLKVSSGSATWNNGTEAQSITVNESGSYWASVTNACGTVSDTVTVNFVPCNLWFPSAFTPNGDGLNDIIRVGGDLALIRDFSLSIYNRWGQRVFYTTDINAGWDGKFKGEKQDSGTFFYMINYSIEGKKRLMKGDFELIR